MSPERWEKLEPVIGDALDLTARDQQEYLKHACADSTGLRAEAWSLLRVRKDMEGFLEIPATPDAAAKAHPVSIGRYRILGVLGEGGMGVVYEAEQESPRRTVALKVIRSGLSGAEILRRFELESHALGRLQHPGIAQVYEAGVADSGFGSQPYFAMELIHGAPLVEYAARQGLSARQRLELIANVCDAVHRAHQRGIIHRDLKPGNILVDESGQPKILDFGVAYVTHDDGGAAHRTGPGQMIGTPAYMSPEELGPDPCEPDTRSDVYALGVMLFEVLAGRLPHKTCMPLAAMVRAIREDDAVLLGSIKPAYRGDIEAIAAKALAQDKERRYSSAADLAADIRRYLHDEPITARRPSATYQLQKFARRHKGLVAGSAAVVTVLLAGVVSTTHEAARARRAEWLALRERDQSAAARRTADRERDRALTAERAAMDERNIAVAERRRADNEAAAAKAISKFSQKDLLAQVSASEQAEGGAKPDPDLTVRAALDRAAAAVDRGFQTQPLIEASIRQTIGNSYTVLGLYSAAQGQLERSLGIRMRSLGTAHPDLLRTKNDLAELYLEQGNHAGAEPLFATVLRVRRRLLGENHADTLTSMANLGRLYQNQGKYAEAEPLFEKVFRIRRRTLGEEHRGALSSLNGLARLYEAQGKNAEAMPLFERLFKLRRRTLGEEHPDTLTSMNNLAILYVNLGKYTEAEPLLRSVVEARRRLLGPEHPNTFKALNNLAMLYTTQKRFVEAEPPFRSVLEARRRLLGSDHPSTLTSTSNLAVVYLHQNRYADAEPLLKMVYETRRRLMGDDHPDTLTNKNNLASLYRSQGRYATAQRLYSEVVEARRRLNGDHPDTLASMNDLASVYQCQRDYDSAQALYQVVLNARSRVLGEEHPHTLASFNSMANLYLQRGRSAEAEPLCRQLLEVSRKARGPGHPATLPALACLGRVRLGQGRSAEAESLLREAWSGQERNGSSGWERFQTQSALGASVAAQARFAEAEAMLLRGYEGLIESKAELSWEGRLAIEQAIGMIVRLYQEWTKPDKAAEWQEQLRTMPR